MTKQSKILPVVAFTTPSLVAETTVNQRIAAIVNADVITDEQVTAIRIALSAKAARVDNPDSVANLTSRYNALVPVATALGVKNARHHSSLFGSVAGGKDILAKLEAAIAAAQTDSEQTDDQRKSA